MSSQKIITNLLNMHYLLPSQHPIVIVIIVTFLPCPEVVLEHILHVHLVALFLVIVIVEDLVDAAVVCAVTGHESIASVILLLPLLEKPIVTSTATDHP